MCSIQKTYTIPADKLVWICPYYYITFVDWTHFVGRKTIKCKGSHATQELLENGSEPWQTELRLIYERFRKKSKNQQSSYSSASQAEAKCGLLEPVTIDRWHSRVYKKARNHKVFTRNVVIDEKPQSSLGMRTILSQSEIPINVSSKCWYQVKCPFTNVGRRLWRRTKPA